MAAFVSSWSYTIVQSHPGSALHPAAGLPITPLGGKLYVAKNRRGKKSIAIIECSGTSSNTTEVRAEFAGASDFRGDFSDRAGIDASNYTDIGTHAEFSRKLFLAGHRRQSVCCCAAGELGFRDRGWTENSRRNYRGFGFGG